jgi:hypothetical protein
VNPRALKPSPVGAHATGRAAAGTRAIAAVLNKESVATRTGRTDNRAMAKKKHEELLLRMATLSSACPNVSVGASERKGEPPRFGGHHWLIFRGTLGACPSNHHAMLISSSALHRRG